MCVGHVVFQLPYAMLLNKLKKFQIFNVISKENMQYLLTT